MRSSPNIPYIIEEQSEQINGPARTQALFCLQSPHTQQLKITCSLGVQLINKLAYAWKQTQKNILHPKDMYQLPWRVGSQRRLHFSYYMFYFSSKFLQRAQNLLLLQSDKSNKDIYQPLL